MTTPAILYAAKSTEDHRGSIPTELADHRALAERDGWTVGEISRLTPARRFAGRGSRRRPCVPCTGSHRRAGVPRVGKDAGPAPPSHA